MILSAIAVFTCMQGEPAKLPVGPVNCGYMSISWSPDGKQIAFVRLNPGDPPKFSRDQLSVCVADADGSNERTLQAKGTFVDWERSGRTLIVADKPAAKSQLFRVDISTGKATALTNADFDDSQPVASPTSDEIAFVSDREGDGQEMYVMDSDGSNLRRLTDGPGKAYNPVWSPDGSSLVFYRETGDQKDQVWTVRADGSDQRRISNPEHHNFYPAFLPNGDISYTDTIPGSAGSRRTVITSADGTLKSTWPFDAYMMRWSPAANKAISVVGGWPKMGLYVSNLDGSNPVRVGVLQ